MATRMKQTGEMNEKRRAGASYHLFGAPWTAVPAKMPRIAVISAGAAGAGLRRLGRASAASAAARARPAAAKVAGANPLLNAAGEA